MNSDWIRHVQEHEAILSNEDIAEAYLVDKRIKRLEKYLDAGRRFETLPVEFLSAQWIDAYRLVVAAPHKALGWALLMPLHCEFYLRGIEPPRGQVEAQTPLFYASLELLRRMNDPDPLALEEAQAKATELRAWLQQPRPWERYREALDMIAFARAPDHPARRRLTSPARAASG